MVQALDFDVAGTVVTAATHGRGGRLRGAYRGDASQREPRLERDQGAKYDHSKRAWNTRTQRTDQVAGNVVAPREKPVLLAGADSCV